MKTKTKTRNKVKAKRTRAAGGSRSFFAKGADGSLHRFAKVVVARQAAKVENLTLINSAEFYASCRSGVAIFDRRNESAERPVEIVKPLVAQSAPVIERNVNLRDLAQVAFSAAMQAIESHVNTDRLPVIVHIPAQGAQANAH